MKEEVGGGRGGGGRERKRIKWIAKVEKVAVSW